MIRTRNPRTHCLTASEARGMLDGRITQVRVPVKGLKDALCWDTNALIKPRFNGLGQWSVYSRDGIVLATIHCPLGRVRDEVWFKEPWMPGKIAVKGYESLLYAADNGEKRGWYSAHRIPREHIRLRRRIAGVRVERVSEISEEDAIKCGFEHEIIHGVTWWGTSSIELGDLASERFQTYWQKRYPRHPWETSWCWVVDLENLSV